MFPDLSKSVELLCNLVQSLLQDDSFPKNFDVTASVIENGKLYWNIGAKQGFVVIDPKERKVYRVFEVSEPLTDHQTCDPALAQLVLEDLFYFMDSIAEDLLAEGLLTLYLSTLHLKSNKSIN